MQSMSHRIRSILTRYPNRPQLGRWCTPSYASSCDQDRKADLNNRDHSMGEPKDLVMFAKVGSEEADLCPWHNPMAVTVMNAYGWGGV